MPICEACPTMGACNIKTALDHVDPMVQKAGEVAAEMIERGSISNDYVSVVNASFDPEMGVAVPFNVCCNSNMATAATVAGFAILVADRCLPSAITA